MATGFEKWSTVTDCNGCHYLLAEVYQSLNKIYWAPTTCQTPRQVPGTQTYRRCRLSSQSSAHAWAGLSSSGSDAFSRPMGNVFYNVLLYIKSVWGQLVFTLLFLKLLADHALPGTL